MTMRYLITLLTAFTFVLSAFSQNDTTYLFYNKGWQPCQKDTAYYVGKIFRQGELWAKRDAWVKTGQLQMEATFLDSDCKKPHGTATYFRENGTVKSRAINENGKRVSAIYFYESGKKKGEVNYTQQGITQRGFDEAGNEIPGYVVEREAMFAGGPEGWKKYLEKNIDANVAARSSNRTGLYPVKVQFIVDATGKVSNVEAVEFPPDCKRCAKEAVRIIKNGPRWEPAMQDNKAVIYQAIQYITFQVAQG